MNIWLILHLASIVLLIIGIIIPAGLMRSADGENRARRLWLILAGVAAGVFLVLFIVTSSGERSVGAQEETLDQTTQTPGR